MKSSELIKQLKGLKEKYGDLDVGFVASGHEGFTIHGIALVTDDNDYALEFTLYELEKGSLS